MAIGYDLAVQESPHEREGIDCASWVSFRGLTGLVGLVALLYVANQLVEFVDIIDEWIFQVVDLPSWISIVTGPAGWVGLVYACWIRSGRITDTALAFVWALGFCGMAISCLALGGPDVYSRLAVVLLTGTWILNGLGILWIVDKVRRIRAASNTDGGCNAMTDVTVSNARRIGFTALALVAFWVSVWQLYIVVQELYYRPMLPLVLLYAAKLEVHLGIPWYISAALVVGSLPSVFVLIATHSSVADVARRWRSSLFVTFVFVGTLCWVAFLGEEDADRAAESLGITAGSTVTAPLFWVALEVSWFWLLLPVIAATAFVIFGAWRSAGRDAAIQAVDQDE